MRGMKGAFLALGVFFALASAAAEQNTTRPVIEAKGGSIYINGNKFLIKGIGYSPYRPGQWPGAKVPLSIVEQDFRRIKDAGFNTLRVWDVMPEEQLSLAEKYGLKVIQAFGLKPDADFTYSGFVRSAESKVREACKVNRDHANVIMYLVMNEPHADAALRHGSVNTLDFYRRMVEIVRAEDPGRPVSMANAYWTLWLDQSLWDVVSFNTYSYSSLAADIGYANFVKNLKEIHSKNKPLLVTEVGLSVSPSGEGKFGYGGNSEEEQAKGLASYFRQLISGGAAGGCVFEWNDEWWKNGNPAIHDDHAEEWFGIIGIKDKTDAAGKPRKAYYALQDELKLIVTKPADGARIADSTDIEVLGSPSVRYVQYRIDSGIWTTLTKKGEWWIEHMDCRGLKTGLHMLEIRGVKDSGELLRQVNIVKCPDDKCVEPPLSIRVFTDKGTYKNGDVIKIYARIEDRDGGPVKDHPVDMGALNVVNNYTRYWHGKTDASGVFSKSVPVLGRLGEWYYIFWAGADAREYGTTMREGKIIYAKAELGGGYPIKYISARHTDFPVVVDGVAEEKWQKAPAVTIGLDSNFAEGNLKDEADLDAEVKLLWDEKNIYILVRVADDVPMNNRFDKADIWKGDCIEFFLSANPSKIPQEGYSQHDFQILIGTNGRMWSAGQAKGGVRNNVPMFSDAAATKSHNGYILEARINVSNFRDAAGPGFMPGEVLGFDVAIGDADKGQLREGKLVWNGTSEGYKDSSVWGRVKLE